ncbi:hypothetical protein QR680_005786 [Steinernema hermaphroditum]|uniref:Phospholipase A(2) n=1 Tax=Steinernema hermaphroditum TaxID=289476 RepID=A0AA39LWC0_9BILA|nr:hypothetical protein QR680_005786 [Steinernema hermaphroditum]
MRSLELTVVALCVHLMTLRAQPYPVSLEPWHCGTDSYSFSSAISRKLFGFGCRADLTAARINQCCLSHDRCYCTLSESRFNCDRTFCDCLRSVTQDDNFFCRVILMESTCFLASKFGDSPYQECSADFLSRIGLPPRAGVLGRWNRRR